MPFYCYIGILIIAVGASIILYQIYLFIKTRSSKNWEVTEGEIISSDVETFNITNEDGKTYRAEVSYKYSILGKQHISSRIFFGDKIRTGFKGQALKLVNKYVIGSKVAVYYNPRNVEESVLETGVSFTIYALLITGISAILFGVVLIKYYPIIKEIFR
jgi:hypothetical protein